MHDCEVHDMGVLIWAVNSVGILHCPAWMGQAYWSLSEVNKFRFDTNVRKKCFFPSTYCWNILKILKQSLRYFPKGPSHQITFAWLYLKAWNLDMWRRTLKTFLNSTLHFHSVFKGFQQPTLKVYTFSFFGKWLVLSPATFLFLLTALLFFSLEIWPFRNLFHTKYSYFLLVEKVALSSFRLMEQIVSHFLHFSSNGRNPQVLMC
jgi:hypothetical protein